MSHFFVDCWAVGLAIGNHMAESPSRPAYIRQAKSGQHGRKVRLHPSPIGLGKLAQDARKAISKSKIADFPQGLRLCFVAGQAVFVFEDGGPLVEVGLQVLQCAAHSPCSTCRSEVERRGPEVFSATQAIRSVGL